MKRLLALLLLACLTACQSAPRTPAQIDGIAWQPHNGAPDPKGHWEHLGANQLFVQWSVVDGVAFVPGTLFELAPRLPNWRRIGEEPWAQGVILGLAGRFDAHAARRDVAQLVQQSAKVAAALTRQPLPVNVRGWYFPVEWDPTWTPPAELALWLQALPRPLWISVFDNSNLGAAAFADRLQSWLPADVGVLFQDGVGVHAREAVVARSYATELQRRLGPQRFKLLAEVFRPQVGGGFRPATVDEIHTQLSEYEGFSVLAFDGPHYLSDEIIFKLAVKQRH